MADQVADHDKAGGDFDTGAQFDARRQIEPANGVTNADRGADRVGGIVFIGARVTEIGEHAVAHVLQHVAADSAMMSSHAAR